MRNNFSNPLDKYIKVWYNIDTKEKEEIPMKITVENQGRTFECYPGAECGGKMCSVNVFEVKRPNWKIFRTSYFGNRCFWIDDYTDIQEGIEDIVGWLIRQEKRDHERMEKWSALEKFGNSH